MLKRNLVGAIGALLILVSVVLGAFLSLQKECSLGNTLIKFDEHVKPNGTSDYAENPDSSKKSAAPETDEPRPPATLKLRAANHNEIDGTYYAENSEGEKENWTHKFWCETKSGEFAIAIFTFLLVIFTGGLWLSTSKLWQVTNDTLTHAENTAKRQLRAYLAVEKCTLRYREGQPVATVKIRNCGQTPAENVVMVGHLDVIQRQTTFVVGGFSQNISKGRLGPGFAFTLESELKHALTPDQIEGLTSRTHWIIVAGDIEYVDIFGNAWHLPYEFCTGGKYGKAIRQGPMSISTDAKNETQRI
jgi:hypothetical protein